jgi:glucose/arabinose dehydrogenase
MHIESLEDRTLFTTVPSGFTETIVAQVLDSPTAFAFLPDGRMLVDEQTGDMRIIKNGSLLATPVLHKNVETDGERGLLGVAVDPHFSKNHFIYAYYTSPSPAPNGHNRVSRFTLNGDVAVHGSEKVIFDLPGLSDASNHNGGSIHFGPDGKLYIGVGENAHPTNSQSLHTLLGKVLRINPNGTIPSDNPFFGRLTGKNRAIWAYGVRNPYTFAFQPGTGMMYINDVGQDTYEEIDIGKAGANYGWPTSEGPLHASGFTKPIFYYSHNVGEAITGGAFYDPRAANFPSKFVGQYFFSDYAGGWIHRLNTKTHRVTGFATEVGSPVDLTVGKDGAGSYLDHDGDVGRIAFG